MKNILLTFKEHRLICQQNAPSPTPPQKPPGLFKGIGQLGGAAGTLANSFADLVNVVTDGLSSGVGLVDYGVAKAKKGIDIMVEEMTDPGQPTNLPEYREMSTFFTIILTSTGDQHLDDALNLRIKLIFLRYKAVEYAEFLQPTTDQSILLKRAIDDIDYKNRIHRPRIQELSSLIEDREATISGGHLLKTDPRRIDLETELVAYKSEKEQLQRECSYEKDWPKPQYQQTEFPPGSGIYIDRLIFDPTQKVKIDLRELHRVTEVDLARHDRILKDYGKEVDRLIYHSNRLLEDADKSVPNWAAAEISFKAQDGMFQRQGQMREQSIISKGFTTKGTPTDVGILAGAIRNTTPTVIPRPVRPTPTTTAEDFFNSLP